MQHIRSNGIISTICKEVLQLTRIRQKKTTHKQLKSMQNTLIGNSQKFKSKVSKCIFLKGGIQKEFAWFDPTYVSSVHELCEYRYKDRHEKKIVTKNVISIISGISCECYLLF